MRCFGAPVVILICIDEAYLAAVPNIATTEVGIATYAITLAAVEYELGTCIQFGALCYAGAIKKALGIPESKIICSFVSMGYPDREAPINNI